jgi:hypothetical protein
VSFEGHVLLSIVGRGSSIVAARRRYGKKGFGGGGRKDTKMYVCSVITNVYRIVLTVVPTADTFTLSIKYNRSSMVGLSW